MIALALEPTVALRTAIRSRLVDDAAVAALVAPENIRSGSTRPDRTPCIILTGGQTQYLGHAAGSQLVARVFLDIHIWALEDGADTAQAIGFAVARALIGMPRRLDTFDLDSFDQPRFMWMRDPSPELAYTHGVGEIEGVMRWKV